MLGTKIAPWPHYSQDEINAAVACLESGKVNQWTGTKVAEFERSFALHTDSKHAIAVSNGTVALDLILKALPGVEAGGEVIVTPRTFVASASSIVNAGLSPVFADVDRDTQNITAETIAAVITPMTRAIICVHLAGLPCDMDPIMELAKKHDLYVIEDCAQAHGAQYKGKSVGSIGHAAAWSFCQDKIMSTGGEGGMITTNDTALYEDIWSLKDHGKTIDMVFNTVHPPGFRWVHDRFGSNYRMTEMAAAIGLEQLWNLHIWVDIRNELAEQYNDVAQIYSCIRYNDERLAFNSQHAKYKHYLFVDVDGMKEGWSRDRIIEELTKRGVPCYQGSCSEVYLESAFRTYGIGPKERLPVAKELGETSLMFLVHPTITKADMEFMLYNINEVFRAASKEVYE